MSMYHNKPIDILNRKLKREWIIYIIVMLLAVAGSLYAYYLIHQYNKQCKAYRNSYQWKREDSLHCVYRAEMETTNDKISFAEYKQLTIPAN